MLFNRNRSCLLLLCLQFFGTANGIGGEIREITIGGRWIKVFDEINNTTSTIQITRTWKEGLRTLNRDDRAVMVRHISGTSSSSNIGAEISLLSVSVSYESKYGVERSNQSKSFIETEIHREQQQTSIFTIPPWTRFTQWQFIADVVGNDYKSHHIVNLMDGSHPPDPTKVVATIEAKKKIIYGTTPIRIKHKDRNQYITKIPRDYRPAALLGSSDRYHFVLHDHGYKGIRIKSQFMSEQNWYNILYMSQDDQKILYDEFDENDQQYWTIGKAGQLFDGDVVSFRNHYYYTSFMCYWNGDEQDVYGVYRREELWILEVV